MIKRISIRELLAFLIIMFCFAILFYTLIKFGVDAGTRNLILGAAITGISIIGGYYFQSSHKPGGVVNPTQVIDTHSELIEPLKQENDVQPTPGETPNTI